MSSSSASGTHSLPASMVTGLSNATSIPSGVLIVKARSSG